MTTRDILEEARFWRANMDPRKVELKEALRTADDEQLEKAYGLWWAIYTGMVQGSKTASRPEGISEYDASRAARIANVATIEYLREHD